MNKNRVLLIACILIAAVGVAAADEDLLIVQPGRTPYTSEAQGLLIVTTSDALKGKELALTAVHKGNKLLDKHGVEAGSRAMIPLDLTKLANGSNEIICGLSERGRSLTKASVILTKLPSKANDVKIDNTTNSLIVNGAPFLPMGFYCDNLAVPKSSPGYSSQLDNLPEEESLHGFNLICPYWSVNEVRTPEQLRHVREVMDRAAAVGVKVNYQLLASEFDGEKQEALIRSEVEAFKDHPALLSWNIADEPEARKVPAQRLINAYKLIRQIDPYHPVTMVMVGIDKAPDYLAAMDFVIVDNYPVPHHQLPVIAEWIQKAQSGVKGRKPVWFVPQAFGGGEFFWREPTANEVRVMTYLPIIQGASGLMYFTRRPPNIMPGSPIVWSECRTLAAELTQLAPAILSPEQAPKIIVKKPDTVTYKSVYTPGYDCKQVVARAFLDRGTLFLVVVNTENRVESIEIAIDGSAYSGTARAIFERRDIQVTNGTLSDTIEGMGTRVYAVAYRPKPHETVEPDPYNIALDPSFEEIVNAGSPASCYHFDWEKGWYGEVKYASARIDPCVARHGRQSLKLTVPGKGTSVSVSPVLLKDSGTRLVESKNSLERYWFRYKPGQKLRISVWAKAKKPGVKFRISDPNLDGLPRDFTLTSDWLRYEVEGVGKKEMDYSHLSFCVLGPGAAWFDLFQVVEEHLE